jgi:hypothetical protein
MNTLEQRPASDSDGGSASSPSAWDLIRGLFRQRAFVVVVGVLLVAALGLNASVQFLQLHFKKQAVPLRQPLKVGLPEVMGTWVQLARDEHLNADMVDALGTKEYLFCHYVNAALLGKSPEALHREFAALSLADQKRQAMEILRDVPSSILSVGVTYYTGSADTVAHIPERCYLADGYALKEQGDPVWPIDGRSIEARYLSFENTDRHDAPDCHVAYLFHVNGGYESKPLKVRLALQNLFSRYGYYAKVELRTDLIDRGRSEMVMRDFLTAALPHVEGALPDWSEYRDRK